jgi:Fic family protein
MGQAISGEGISMNDGPLDMARADLVEAFDDLWRRCNNTIVGNHATLEGLRHSLGCISDDELRQRNSEWLKEHKAGFDAYRAKFLAALEQYDAAREWDEAAANAHHGLTGE